MLPPLPAEPPTRGTCRRQHARVPTLVAILRRSTPPRALGARIPTAVITSASIFAILALWYLVSSLVVRSASILPPPQAVALKFWQLAVPRPGQLSLWPQVVASTLRVLVGWSTGLMAGVLVGALIAGNRFVRASLDPIIQAGRAIPPLAFAPLLLVWFGIGETSKVVLLFASTFPVVAVATAAAISEVDNSYLRVAQALGASSVQIFRRVTLRASLPGIFTSMRVTIAFTWSAVVAAELLAATKGVGWMILQASQYLDTAEIFVGIVVIGVLAFLMDLAIRAVEIRVVPWRGRSLQ